MKKILCLFLIINISYKLSYSQNNSPLELNEAKALIEAYISPLGNSLAAGLNNGWYNSAKTHKALGFDFTLTTNLVLINDNVKDFKFQDIVVGNAFNDTASSTILGNTDGTSFDVLGSDGTTYEVTLPSGENIPVIIVPMLQAGIGIGKSTDLNLRYLPSLQFGRAGRVGVLGGGIKHDLMQWIPFLEKLDVNLAFQGGYTKVQSNIELIDPSGNVNDPALVDLDISAITANLILSKEITIFTPHVSIGYNSSNTLFSVDGKYVIDSQAIPVDALTEFNFETKNDLRTNVGLRIDMTIFALQANYTFSEYPTATIGLGINVR